MTGKEKKILAVSSGGGHWVQLNRLIPAFEGHRLVVVTVDEAYRNSAPAGHFYVVRDATIWNKLGLIYLAIQILRILLMEKPDVVISTGAAPGYFAIRLGKILGAKTIWLDSIANVEKLSLSGQRIGKHADLWLTQWPDLVRPGGPEFKGSVL